MPRREKQQETDDVVYATMCIALESLLEAEGFKRRRLSREQTKLLFAHVRSCTDCHQKLCDYYAVQELREELDARIELEDFLENHPELKPKGSA